MLQEITMIPITNQKITQKEVYVNAQEIKIMLVIVCFLNIKMKNLTMIIIIE